MFKASLPNASSYLPSIPTTQLVGHEGPIRCIQFSNDGKYCISAGHDRTVRLWNPTRLDPLSAAASVSMPTSEPQTLDSIPQALPIQSYTDGHAHPISAIALDDLSTTLLSTSDKALIVTDVITQKIKRRFQGHTGRINSVASSQDASVFLSGSYDGTVRLWDGRSWNTNPVQVLKEATDSISSTNILQGGDGVEIVTAGIDGKLRSYDLRRGLIHVDDLGSDVALTSVSHTSDRLCSVVSCLDGAIHIMERSTGVLLNTCYGGHVAGRYSLECHVTADDRFLVSGSEDGSAVVYDFENGKVVQRLNGHSKATCTVACHPKREHTSVVITGSYDGSAIVWSNGNRTHRSD